MVVSGHQHDYWEPMLNFSGWLINLWEAEHHQTIKRQKIHHKV